MKDKDFFKHPYMFDLVMRVFDYKSDFTNVWCLETEDLFDNYTQPFPVPLKGKHYYEFTYEGWYGVDPENEPFTNKIILEQARAGQFLATRYVPKTITQISVDETEVTEDSGKIGILYLRFDTSIMGLDLLPTHKLTLKILEGEP